MGCGTQLAALQWAPSYHRATWMQAPLAAIGTVAGVAVWWRANPVAGWRRPVGMRDSVHLYRHHADQSTAADARQGSLVWETHVLLERWGSFHAVRSLLSLAASLVYPYPRGRMRAGVVGGYRARQ